MLLIAPVAAGDTPRSRRSEHRSAAADLATTARTGQRANAAQPLPALTFEDSHPLLAALQVIAALVLWALVGWGVVALLSWWLS